MMIRSLLCALVLAQAAGAQEVMPATANNGAGLISSFMVAKGS